MSTGAIHPAIDISSIAQERNQILRAVVEASPVSIIVIDPGGIVRLWNPAAERLFGWNAAEVTGRPLPIVPTEKLTESRSVRDAIARGESVFQVEDGKSAARGSPFSPERRVRLTTIDPRSPD